MTGRIDINKPMGMSSHDVVNRVRRILSEKHVGHSGTLDPNATGVLNVYVGRQATKFIDLLKSERKEYLAEMKFGLTSDTLDIWGNLREVELNSFSRASLEQTLHKFLGKSLQTPPMYSALKRSGVALYKLAREGKEIDREAREIEIFEIELIDFESPLASFRVVCSKGTYIRSLVDDIARCLGTGAVMSSLVRSVNDHVRLSECVELDDISPQLLKSVDADSPLPRITITATERDALLQGKPVAFSSDYIGHRLILDLDGKFQGTAIYQDGTYVRERMFV